LGFVRKLMPLFGKGEYHDISDNYTRFWFRFVSPYFSDIVALNERKKETSLSKNRYLCLKCGVG